jgi:demethylmenaquinone methyltransferase / 2-methoxy-6-polyprenyl-1,4-benzoquinol methylase
MKHSVQELFDRTARSYDFLNHLFTFNIDSAWRSRLITRSGAAAGARVLDVCTGTGDVALAFARKVPGAAVVGLDFSSVMLEKSRAKIGAAGLSDRVSVKEGDALNLPFADGAFDIVCNSFGLRTLEDRPRAVAEMARVTAPGGRVLALEFLPPPNTLFGRVYAWHLKSFMPFFGGALSGYRRAYTYLYETIALFPNETQMTAMFQDCGLRDVSADRLTGGIAYLFCGVRTA